MNEKHNYAGAFDADALAAINAARNALRRIAKTTPHTPQDGQTREAVDAAESALFNAVNTANAYLHLDIPDNILHARVES